MRMITLLLNGGVEDETLDDEVVNDNPDEGGAEQEPVDDGASADDSGHAEPEVDHLDRVIGMLGEPGEDETVDLSQVTEREIEAMPPQARHMFRMLKKAADDRVAQANEGATAIKTEAEQILAQARAEQANLAQSRQAFAKMFANEDVRKAIDAGKNVDLSKIDHTTADGQKAIAQKTMADALAPFVEPIQDHAFQSQRQATHDSMMAKYRDDFAQDGFDADVNALITAAEARKESVAGRLEEFIKEARYQRFMKAEEDRKRRRAAEHRRSQQHVARHTGGAGRDAVEGPPPHVRNNPQAMAEWVASDPKRAEAFAKSLRA